MNLRTRPYVVSSSVLQLAFVASLGLASAAWADLPAEQDQARIAPGASPLTPLTDMHAPGAPRRVFVEPAIVRLLSGDQRARPAPGTILAWHKAVVLPAQLTNRVAIDLPRGLGAVAADSTFVLQSAPAGRSACLTKTEEPRDPDGTPLAVCVFDSDGDGFEDRLIVGRDQPRVIPRMKLRPLRPDSPTRVAPPELDFRIVLTEVAADRLTLICGVTTRTGGGQRRYTASRIQGGKGQPDRCRLDLPLQAGARAEFLGLSLRLDRDSAGEWWLVVSGTATWLSLSDDGTVIDASVITLEMI